jgi:DNA-directed RNA polymerase subunit RPC12/RpoP
MPRYRYVCTKCSTEHIIFHLYEEEPLTNCSTPECAGCLVRSVTKPVVPHVLPVETTTGELTEEFIEESKEALKQQKREAKESTYEPS